MRYPAMLLLLLTVPAAAMIDSPVTPDGDGPPNLVVCRAPQAMPGSRLPGPRVCNINAVWAQYHRDGMDLAPDGVHAVPSEKYRSSHPVTCRPTSPGGGSIATLAQISASTVCE